MENSPEESSDASDEAVWIKLCLQWTCSKCQYENHQPLEPQLQSRVRCASCGAEFKTQNHIG